MSGSATVGADRVFCKHVELEFYEDVFPTPHHKILFGSRFRDRRYPLSIKRALHYVKKATPEELEIIDARCGTLVKELGYEVPLFSENQTKGGA